MPSKKIGESELPQLFRKFLALLLFLGFGLFFFLPTLTGEASFFSTFDNSSQTYPWIHFVVHHLKNLQIPLWDATTYSGISFPGEMQTGPFYPGYWLLALLVPLHPDGTLPMVALEIFAIAHFVLAGWFMSLFLRGNKLGWLPSLLGGVLFAFVGSTALRANGQLNMFLGLCWLPILLLFTQRALAAKKQAWKTHWVYGAGLALAMPVLAGHMAPTLLDAFALTLFVLYLTLTSRGRIPPLRALMVFGLIGVSSLLFAAPQLATGVEYLGNAYRWVGAPEAVKGMDTVPYEVYGKTAILKAKELWTLVQPSLSVTTEDGGTLFLTFTGLGLAVLGILSRKRLALFFFLLAVLTTLISLGDQTFMGPIAWRTPILNKVRQPTRALYLFDFATASLAAFGLANLLRLLKEKRRVALTLGLIALLATGFETYLHRKQLFKTTQLGDYPPTAYKNPLIEKVQSLSTKAHLLHRVHIYVEALPPNMGNIFPIHSSIGHRATLPVPYNDFLGQDWSMDGKIMDRLGVKWLLTKREEPKMHLLAKDGEIKLYERPHSLSVFHWELENGERREAQVAKVRWGQGEVELELKPHQGGPLIFAQVPYPGWKVRVEGKSRPLENIHDLNGVRLKKGENHLLFYYSPWSFWGTLPLPILALLLWAFLLIRSAESRRVTTLAD
ncbi:MAG TPA: hypothetical protein ENK02_05000 [Planctomycetes bacterium]|nr:hypothetical protein [Planctomycetota bacterium]